MAVEVSYGGKDGQKWLEMALHMAKVAKDGDNMLGSSEIKEEEGL